MGSLRFILLLILLAVVLPGADTSTAQDDGIYPCPYSGSAYHRPGLFPRYEPQNRRLVLADVTTGQNVQDLGTDLDWTVALDWSLDCRYLAAAVGSSDSLDTVVFDTVAATRIGQVPDAHGQPHHITWGPGDYLIVETRSGAVLWNVPANTQIVLTPLFNTTTARNFSRIRWDAEHHQVLVNLAVGGRTAFDLSSGAEVAPANVIDSVPGDGTGTAVVGAREYQCQYDYRYGWKWGAIDEGYVLPGIYANYDIQNGLIVLVLGDYGQPRSNYENEVIQAVEDHIHAAWFRFRGWSSTCRYFAGVLGIPGTNDSETVVWDVRTNQRVFTLTAHETMHAISWGPGDSLLVETRDGAQLWHLPTATRTILVPNVEMRPEGTTVRNFHYYEWDNTHGQLLGVPIGLGDTVAAYDVITGQQVGTYSSGGTGIPVGFELSPDSRLIALYHPDDGLITVWDRDSGTSVHLNPRNYTDDISAYVGQFRLPQEIFRRGLAISPDNRYVVYALDALLVWDLHSLTPDAGPNNIFPDTGLNNVVFEDHNTVRSVWDRLHGIDVVSGERVDYVEQRAIRVTTPLDGQSGTSHSSNPYWRTETRACLGIYARYDVGVRQLEVVDSATRSVVRVLESDLNRTRLFGISPDCRIVAGLVSLISNAPVPFDDAPFDDHFRDRQSDTLVFWDAVTGARLAEFPNPHWHDSEAWLYWSPDGSRVLIQTSEGYFLWHPASGQTVMLSYMIEPPGRDIWRDAINTDMQVYWDFQRGQILISGWNAIHAFDLQTGVERYRFGECSSFWGCSFRVSEDNARVRIGANGSWGRVFDLDTLECVPSAGPWGRYDDCEDAE